ncbi:MAG: hypothetical protein WD066_20250 [Planctomycetaceae bacterium]
MNAFQHWKRFARRKSWAAIAAASLSSCTALSSKPEPTPPTVHLGPALIDSIAVRPPVEAQRIAHLGGVQQSNHQTAEQESAGRIDRISGERIAPEGAGDAPATNSADTTPGTVHLAGSPQIPPGGPMPPAMPADMRVQFTPAEPRVAIEDGGPALYPDEYLFDGGDRGIPVHYDHIHRHGLDTEDTIAEYTDDRGNRHMRPSNRVAVYAPRFASVRTLGGPQAHVGVGHPAAARDRTGIVDARHRQGPTRHDQRLAGTSIRVRSRASRYDIEQAWSETAQSDRVSEHQKLANVYQNVTFLRTGRLEDTDAAWLATRIQAAITWSRDQQVMISAKVDGVQEVKASLRESTLVGTEDDVADGPLRIVKLADRAVAEPGDIVTFTIRYDNLGDRPVHHVRIVDNLTPRLEYVADSADSDRAGRLVVEDNAEGSLVLIFEVDEPIPGRQGGVVTFQARVR